MSVPIYRAIDHVMIRLISVDQLFSLFSNVLGLPVSWPLQRSSFATFGWINVGNTDLELWAAASNSDLPYDCQPPLFHGFALDPVELSSNISKLAELGIACKTPRPYQTTNEHGLTVTNFTNSVVLDLSSETCCIFFCDWDKNGSIFPWKERLTSVERRARDQDAFEQCKGGALGIVGLSQIELCLQNLSDATTKWCAMTGSDSMPIALIDETILELSAGKHNVIQSLTFEVRSLAVAKAFLADKDLLEVVTESELVLALTATGGLRFRFVEAGQKWRTHSQRQSSHARMQYSPRT